MKTKFLLFAIPCLFLAACNGSASKADKQKTDSLNAVAHMDSLMNAAKMNHKQDSIMAAKEADSTKKADSAKGQK
jgi:HAMP domain-containing protein